ncbi:MAG: hemolysin family protein [Ruminococcus sp.]|nr:hemolysin family protein [Ruminococcus sp.]
MVFFIIVCLLISSVCSATETAFSSVNRIRLRNFAESGNKSAEKALKIIDNFDKALTTILVGNNVVNIASSSMATVLFTEQFGGGSVGIATLVMTILVLIFGEIIPKSLAKQNSESFSVFMAVPLSFAMFVLTPITTVFMSINSLATKLFVKKNNQPTVTEEELKYIIDEIEDEGVLEEQESDLVRSALEFDEITISEILVPRVNITAIELNTPIDRIRTLFLESGFSRLPVFENSIDSIIGILHKSDFYELYLNKENDITSRLKKPVFISENKRISEALREIKESKVHMAVVVDQYGGTEGICTLEDIIEELVGEIYDETDREDTSFVRISNDRFEISPDLSVSDFLDRLDLPEDTIITERNSMGGFVMDILDRIPEPNEFLSYGIFNMTVIMEDEQKICKIKIRIKDNIRNTETNERI